MKTLGLAVVGLSLTGLVVGCSSETPEQEYQDRAEDRKAAVVSWCDGADKVWSFKFGYGGGLSVVANHPDCVSTPRT